MAPCTEFVHNIVTALGSLDNNSRSEFGLVISPSQTIKCDSQSQNLEVFSM